MHTPTHTQCIQHAHMHAPTHTQCIQRGLAIILSNSMPINQGSCCCTGAGAFHHPLQLRALLELTTKMSMLGVTIAASLVTLQKSSPPVIILSMLSMLFAPNSRCKTNLNSPSLSADTGAGVLVVDWHLAPTERQEDEDWYNAGGHELRQLGTTRPTSKRCLVVCDFTRH